MADDDLKTRLVGKSVSRTVIQLVVISIIVGAFFSFIGLGPREFWRGLFHGLKDILGTLGENVSEIVLTLFTYLLIGAAIVVPIWLITRLLSGRK